MHLKKYEKKLFFFILRSTHSIVSRQQFSYAKPKPLRLISSFSLVHWCCKSMGKPERKPNGEMRCGRKVFISSVEGKNSKHINMHNMMSEVKNEANDEIKNFSHHFPIFKYDRGCIMHGKRPTFARKKLKVFLCSLIRPHFFSIFKLAVDLHSIIIVSAKRIRSFFSHEKN